ncbi:hypothetical protein PHMEG_00016176, partial [Phytophthora megakarya]
VSKRPDLHGNTCDLHGKHTFAISSLRQVDEYASAEVIMSVDLQPGEFRGYCRQQEPDLWLKPTDHEVTPEIQRPSKISEYRRSTTGRVSWLLETSFAREMIAHVSIVDTTFARKVWCYIDSSQIQDCVRIDDNITGIFLRYLGGDLTGQQAILGMDFMVPAGIRLDLAHGSINLPDEVRIQLSGRRQLYSDKAKIVNVD